MAKKENSSELVFEAEKSIVNAEKLIKWIDDVHRPKASSVFTEGPERQIAQRFETLFSRLNTLKN